MNRNIHAILIINLSVKVKKREGELPAILYCFGKVFDKVAGDIQNLELREAANGIWEGPKLVGAHV